MKKRSGIPFVPPCGKIRLQHLILISLFTWFSCIKNIVQPYGYVGNVGPQLFLVPNNSQMSTPYSVKCFKSIQNTTDTTVLACFWLYFSKVYCESPNFFNSLNNTILKNAWFCCCPEILIFPSLHMCRQVSLLMCNCELFSRSFPSLW